jgi:hypothetical protein
MSRTNHQIILPDLFVLYGLFVLFPSVVTANSPESLLKLKVERLPRIPFGVARWLLNVYLSIRPIGLFRPIPSPHPPDYRKDRKAQSVDVLDSATKEKISSACKAD